MEEYWEKLCLKNPAFRKEFVKLKTSSLKAIVRQAYERGASKKRGSDMFAKMFGINK